MIMERKRRQCENCQMFHISLECWATRPSQSRSEETCREADTMKNHLQNEILQLQKSNEQLMQQLQSEVLLRDNIESKVDNVQTVCVTLAEQFERVRTCTSGIGMLEANLRKHQADLQAQMDKLDADYNTLASQCDKEKACRRDLDEKNHEIRVLVVKNLSKQLLKSKGELLDVTSRLHVEQEAQARNLQLLQERETKIKELEQRNVSQAKSYESQINNSGSTLAASSSEIASLKQALMEFKLAEKDNLCKIKLLENNKSVNQDTIQTSELKVQKMEIAIAILVQEKNELYQQLRFQKTVNQVHVFEEEKLKMMNELESAQSMIKVLETEKEEYLVKLQEAETTNVSTGKKIRGLEAQIQTLEEEKTKLSTGLEAFKTEFTALLARQVDDLRLRQVDEQVEDLCHAAKTLQQEKKEEILKAKDIQKRVLFYELAFNQQTKDIESENVKYMKEMASVLAAEKKQMEVEFIANEKTWKAERIRLAKSAIHYKSEVKRLKNEQGKIKEINAASSTTGNSAILLKDEIALPLPGSVTPKTKSPKGEKRRMVEEIHVLAPKKRVMFKSVETESDSDDE